MGKEPLLKGNASSAAFDVVNALGGIVPDPVPNGVSLKGKTVVAAGPQCLQRILKSCDTYVQKCEGKDKELGAACYLVRSLAKEVKEQAEIIERKSNEAASEQARMATILEQYLTVFTDGSSLKMDLSNALGQEWVEAHGRVLTPLVLHDALVDSMALLHRLQRDLVNSQVQRARDFPKFEKAVQAFAAEKDQESARLKGIIAQLESTLRRECGNFHAADVTARVEAGALRQKLADTERAGVLAADEAHARIAALQVQVLELQEEGRRREMQAARERANIHMRHIATCNGAVVRELHTTVALAPPIIMPVKKNSEKNKKGRQPNHSAF